MKTIVIAGNPCDGYTYYGPFDSFDDACEYSDRELRKHETWIATLQPPEEVNIQEVVKQ